MSRLRVDWPPRGRRRSGSISRGLAIAIRGKTAYPPRRDGSKTPSPRWTSSRSEHQGLKGFVLMGLCSGADVAFETAKTDDRIRGMVQIDSYCYRTLGYYPRHYGPKLLNAQSWLNVFRGKTFIGAYLKRKLNLTKSEEAAEGVVIPPYEREFPPKEYVEEGLRTLVNRQTRFCNIFTDGQEEHYNHASQYRDSFRSLGFGNLLKVEYIPGCEHTVTDLSHQETSTQYDRGMDATFPQRSSSHRRQPGPCPAECRAIKSKRTSEWRSAHSSPPISRNLESPWGTY